MWHRRGGLLVMAAGGALRVDEQDWSELTLEAFPATGVDQRTERAVRERNGTERTGIVMQTFAGEKHVAVAITEAEGAQSRAWIVRLHLRRGERIARAVLDGVDVKVAHLAPLSEEDGAAFFPLGGRGTAPAPRAGAVAEIHLPASAQARALEVTME